jgi:F420-dependent oxidoreductase-like protein
MTIKCSLYLPTGFAQDLAHIPDPVEAFEAMVAMAKTVDEHGYESIWLPDHMLTVPPSHEKIFEAWTTVAALARETSRVRIGQMVTGNSYRNPGLQAKMASCVDVISHGRFSMGIGAGWYEADYAAYGYEFPSAGERLRQLEEALQVILSLWTNDETTFDGKYYQLRGAVNEPRGIQRPHIPLLIAGAGEKVTLRLVAKYGDACNVIDTPEELVRKYAVLRRHCEETGRDYDAITRTSSSVCVIADSDDKARSLLPPGPSPVYPGDYASYCLIGTPETIRGRLAAYEEAGVQELAITFIGLQGPTDTEVLRQFASECS